MTHRIYITGCAKSGTTLLCRLMTAFNLNVFLEDERPIDFLHPQQPYEVVKRNCDAILSAEIFSKKNLRAKPAVKLEWDRQLGYQEWRQIKLLHIRRNKPDVLKSDNGYVSNARYDAVAYQEELLAGRITHTVDFEALISEPDSIQEDVAAALDLAINTERMWSDYHNWYQAVPNEIASGLYSIRRLGCPSVSEPVE